MKKFILVTVMLILGIALGVSATILFTVHRVNKKPFEISIFQPGYPIELREFIRFTKEIFSGVEVGLNYSQYQDMLVKLNISANNALEKLKGHPDIRQKIEKIVDDFVDARGLWNLDIRTSGKWILNIDSPDMRKFFQIYLDKYPFLLEKAVEDKYDSRIESAERVFSPKKALKLLWEEAAIDFSDLQNNLGKMKWSNK